MTSTYYPTHTRMGAWLVGVILGYILHDLKGKSVRIPKVLRPELKFLNVTIFNSDFYWCWLVNCNWNNAFDSIRNLFYATTGLSRNRSGERIL